MKLLEVVFYMNPWLTFLASLALYIVPLLFHSFSYFVDNTDKNPYHVHMLRLTRIYFVIFTIIYIYVFFSSENIVIGLDILLYWMGSPLLVVLLLLVGSLREKYTELFLRYLGYLILSSVFISLIGGGIYLLGTTWFTEKPEYEFIDFNYTLIEFQNHNDEYSVAYCGVVTVQGTNVNEDEWTVSAEKVKFNNDNVAKLYGGFSCRDYFSNFDGVQRKAYPYPGNLHFKNSDVTNIGVMGTLVGINSVMDFEISNTNIQKVNTTQMYQVSQRIQDIRDEQRLKEINDFINSYICDIKGNVSYYGDLIYHMPGQQYYNVTIAEVMFCTEAEAIAAGFRKSKR